eukprot:TRINITY_DN6782_c0_g2_i1.p1 TRINITY_DN6782_c0_g2~~TRINITY_DN6782_c0_g2_i1.p1  ORF type:complete len:391 (-),score=52.92 TRINITY_DN6782_c0_g2_i1:438-1532(-)
MVEISHASSTNLFQDDVWSLFSILGAISLVLLLIIWRHGKVAAQPITDIQLKQHATHSNRPRGFLDIRFVEPCEPVGACFTTAEPEPQKFETDACIGFSLVLHKPTADNDLLRSANYAFAAHMHDRKRLWEFRWQITPKKQLNTRSIYFGVEQDQYAYINAVSRMLSKNLVAGLRRVVDLYQSEGDDPKKCRGETERPCCVFSLQTLDQLIVTPPGGQPPSLDDPGYSGLGITKADDRKRFKAAIEDLELLPGHTYTFSFWSVARFADAVGWQSVGSTGVRFQKIGIHPPCYFAMYELGPGLTSTEKRHLDSRKTYCFKLAYWSSLYPPSAQRVQELSKEASSAQATEDSKNEVTKRLRNCSCW